MGIKIDKYKCTGCGTCVPYCPAGVLYVDDDDMKCHATEGCTSCGACVDICTFNALSLEENNEEKQD
jgi:ferredoxin